MKSLNNFPILFVDDDELWLENTIRGLKILGLKKVDGCSNPLNVLDILKSSDYGLVVIDLWMPQKPGEILLSEIKQHYPNLPVIIITADNQIDTAVKCMQNGAINFLTKPIEPNKVISHIKQVVENLSDTNTKVTSSSNTLNAPIKFHDTLSQTIDMKNNFDYIDSISQSILPILITGEKGCGKENLAQSVYHAHRRKDEFFILDVSQISNQDFFFSSKSGESFYCIINSNNKITIYLKNIDLLTKNSQKFLLQYFQDIQSDYHNSISNIANFPKFILSSTLNIIQNKLLIPDFEFLLKIQHIKIAPLRERIIDISLLSTFFITQYVNKNNINTPHIPKELLPLLEHYIFPENIKELNEMITYALINCNRGKLSMESFKEHMESHRNFNDFKKPDNLFSGCKVLPTLKESQYILIIEALKRTNGNQAHAAHLLGITRQGLNRKIQSFNINI